MRNIKPTKVFISAARDILSATVNESRSSELACELALLDEVSSFREVVGCYDGTHEPAFCVFLKPGCILEGVDRLVELAAAWDQYSILVVHGDDAAELCEVGTECSAILGRFQVLPDGEAPTPGEDYTFVDGRYYVVR